VAGEGSRASGVWYSRAVGSGIYINVGTTWHAASKQEVMGVRPERPGARGDLVAPWLGHIFGNNHSRGSPCYAQRRTPQFWSKVYQKHANLTQAEFSRHLEASKIELRSVMLCPEAMQLLQGVGGGDIFPFIAYELGFDSVQIRTADLAGGSSGASEIVLTRLLGIGHSECCVGCSAKKRALSCGAPASTCGDAELRTGCKPGDVACATVGRWP